MKTRFELTVIQPLITPCSENWDTMQPHEKGKFCMSCNKAVYDLADLNAEQLALYLAAHENESICGHVNQDALKHPVLLVEKEEIRSFHFKFILALFLAFGPFLFSCDQKQHEQVKQVIMETISESEQEQGTTFEITEIKKIKPAKQIIADEQKMEEPKDSIPQEVFLDTVKICRSEINERMLLSGGAWTTIRYSTIEFDTVAPEPQIIETEPHLPLLVYPNPAREEVTIQYEISEDGTALLSCFSVNGEKIKDILSTNQATPGQYSDQMNVSDLPSGMYIVILINNDHKEIFRLSVVR